MITELFPIITTTDLGRSLAFWRDQMGGRVVYEFSGPRGTPAYVSLELGASSFGIGLAADGVARPPGAIALWVYAEDCEALIERLRVAGVSIVQEPRDEPWGERVAKVLDPDSNEVFIGQRAEAPR
jgi:lactoylglutathione lyase